MLFNWLKGLPGMLLSLHKVFAAHPHDEYDQLQLQVGRNLCRTIKSSWEWLIVIDALSVSSSNTIRPVNPQAQPGGSNELARDVREDLFSLHIQGCWRQWQPVRKRGKQPPPQSRKTKTTVSLSTNSNVNIKELHCLSIPNHLRASCSQP